MRIRAMVVAALVAASGGCMAAVSQPEVEVAGVRLGGIGLSGGLLYVRLNVDNPNRFALEADRLTYDVDLLEERGGDTTWVDFAEGEYDEPIRVGARDVAVVEVPVRFRFSGAGAALRSVIQMGTFNYRISGTVALAEPLSRSIPFRREGTVAVGDEL